MSMPQSYSYMHQDDCRSRALARSEAHVAQSSPTTRAGPDPMRVCPSQLTVGSARPVQCPTRRGKGFGCLVVEVLKKDQPLRRLARVQGAISSNDKTAALVLSAQVTRSSNSTSPCGLRS